MHVRTAKDIGLLVRERRKQLGLTQGQLAERLGTGRPWVVQVEGGKATAQLGMVLAALRELDIDLHVEVPAAAAGTARAKKSVAKPRRRAASPVDLDRIIANAVDRRRR